MEQSIKNLVAKLNRYQGVKLDLHVAKIEDFNGKTKLKYTLSDAHYEDSIERLLIYGMNAKYTFQRLKEAFEYLQRENFNYEYKKLMKILDPFYTKA